MLLASSSDEDVYFEYDTSSGSSTSDSEADETRSRA